SFPLVQAERLGMDVVLRRHGADHVVAATGSTFCWHGWLLTARINVPARPSHSRGRTLSRALWTPRRARAAAQSGFRRASPPAVRRGQVPPARLSPPAETDGLTTFRTGPS